MQINFRVLSNAQANNAIVFFIETLNLSVNKESVFDDSDLTGEVKAQVQRYQKEHELPSTFYMEVD